MKIYFVCILGFVMFFLVYSFQSTELKNIVEGTLPAFKKVDSDMGFKNENTVTSIEKDILKQIPSHITPENSEFNDLNEKVEVKVMMNPLTKQIMEMKFDPDEAMAGLKQSFFRFLYKLSKFDTYMKMVFFVTAVCVLNLMLVTKKLLFHATVWFLQVLVST